MNSNNDHVELREELRGLRSGMRPTACLQNDVENTIYVTEFLTRFQKNYSKDQPSDQTLDLLDKTAATVSVNDKNDKSSPNTDDNNETQNDRNEFYNPLLITPAALTQALEFRANLRQFHTIETLRNIHNMQGQSGIQNHQSSITDNQYLSNLQHLLQSVQGMSSQSDIDNCERIINILNSFETQTCADLANHYLLRTPKKHPMSQDHFVSGCSTLLNMPSGDYFSSILPGCKHPIIDIDSSPHYIGTLAIPPNILTWKEYFRYIQMISNLTQVSYDKDGDTDCDESLVSKSHYTCHSSSLHTDGISNSSVTHPMKQRKQQDDDAKHEKNLHYKKMSSADIAALWIRAQRNTNAWRCLLYLFQVSYIQEENRYEAKYVGIKNSEKYRISVQESTLMDKLTTWAIKNQVMFTYEFITTNSIKPLYSKSNTAKRSLDESPSEQVPLPQSKKMRISAPTIPYSVHLLQAQKSYLLRWFARRHRHILSIAFSSNPVSPQVLLHDNHDQTDMTSTSTLSTNNNVGISDYYYSLLYPNLKKISSHMKEFLKKNHDSTDRTLARIDRRIFHGKYDISTGDTNFEVALERIILAFEYAILKESSQDNVDEKMKAFFVLVLQNLQAALKDWGFLCKMFLPVEYDTTENMNINNTSDDDNPDFIPAEEPKLKLIDNSSLTLPQQLQIDSDNTNVVIELLKSHHQPWAAICSVCDEGEIDEQQCQECWSCGCMAHKDCVNKQGSKGPSELPGLFDFQYLPILYGLDNDTFPEDPDFTKKPLPCTTTLLKLERGKESDGTLSKWGMTLVVTEILDEAYDKVKSSLDNAPILSEHFPLRSNIKGLVVSRIHPSSIAEKHALRVGDIITEVRDSGRVYNLAQMTGKQRMLIFHTRQSCKLDLVVERPSKDIIRIGKEYQDACYKASSFKSFLTKHWRCNACCIDQHHSSHFFENDICFEAKLAQIILRRLGMESCSLPFHEETWGTNVTIDNANISNPFPYVGMRRLDDMLTYIISKNSSDKENIPSNSENNDNNPFSMLISDDSEVKVDWADKNLESKPLELLCKGIGLIINYEFDNNDENNMYRDELKDRFIKLYVSWCACITKVKLKNFTNSPPISAFYAIKPWLSIDSSLENHNNIESASNNTETTVNVANINKENISDVHTDKEKDKTSENYTQDSEVNNDSIGPLEKYDYHASFIGMVILTLPDDPLVNNISKALQFDVQQFDKVVEFLVVSYLPSNYISYSVKNAPGLVREDNSDINENSGIYHLVPILSARQLDFFLSKCEMRKWKSENSSFFADENALQLPGVVQLSEKELMKRISSTHAITSSIDNATAALSTLGSENLNLSSENLSDSKLLSYKEPFRMFDIYDSILNLHEPVSKVFDPDVSNSVYLLSSLIDAYYNLLVTDNHRKLFNEDKPEVKLYELDYDMKEGLKPSCDNRLKLDNDTHGSKSRKAVQRLVLVKDIEAIRMGLCSLYYTDLFYWDERNLDDKTRENYKKINDDISGQVLNRPAQFNANCSITNHKIVLSRISKGGNGLSINKLGDETNDEISFLGIGWGFEILFWHADNTYRVGRIARNSPALNSGLKSHDILKSINGECVNELRTGVRFATALLVSNSTSASFIDHDSNRYAAAVIIKDLENVVEGPVILDIDRVSIPHEIIELDDEDYVEYPTPTNTQQSSTPNHTAPQNDNANLSYVEYLTPTNAHQTSTPNHTAPQNDDLNLSYRKSTNDLYQTFRRRPLHLRDLYKPGVNGTFLTLSEMLIYLEASRRDFPLLGLRLLSPRYDIERLKYEFRTVISPFLDIHGDSSLPFISNDVWMHLVQLDYTRSKNESGDIMFKEKGFSYRRPVAPFPIDRLIESYFRRESVHRRTTDRDEMHDQGERIRGGGGDYANIVVGSVVLCKCNVNDVGGMKLSDIIIGRTVEISYDQTNMPLVSVMGFYIVSSGYLSAKKCFKIASDNLLVFEAADSTTPDDVIVKMYFDRYSPLNSPRAKAKLQRYSFESPKIGVLPNGSDIYWFFTDPTSLYLSRPLPLINQADSMSDAAWQGLNQSIYYAQIERLNKELLENKSTFMLRVCEPEMHCCVWGCSVKNDAIGNLKFDRTILGFESKDELMAHYKKYHSHSIWEGSRWHRISGSTIFKLYCDLCSSVCARCPSFMNRAEKCKSSHCSDAKDGFNVSPLGPLRFPARSELYTDDGGMDLSKIRCVTKCDAQSYQLYRLCLRIRYIIDPKIFDEENASEELESQLGSRLQFESADKNDAVAVPNTQLPNELNSSLIKDHKKSFYQPSSLKTNGLQHHVREEGIQTEKHNLHYNSNQSAIGFSLLTESYFEAHKSEITELLHVASSSLKPCDELDSVKLLLINIAANIPMTILFLSEPTSKRSDDSSIMCTSWNIDHVRIWVYFVKRCHNYHMIVQAYLMLLSFIDETKLPLWWKAKLSGWSSSYCLMNVSSLSGIALHIYAFDAAVAEFISVIKQNDRNRKSAGNGSRLSHDLFLKNVIDTETSQESSTFDDNEYNDPKKSVITIPPYLEILTFPERMITVKEMCENDGLSPYQGDSADYCYKCDDGGSLICCFFCKNVAHTECVGYKESMDDIDWVCDECVSKIST